MITTPNTGNISQEWAKVPEAARFAGVSPRLIRKWIADGSLTYSRLPSGLVLIKLQYLDEYLDKFSNIVSSKHSCRSNYREKADKLVEDILKSFKG